MYDRLTHYEPSSIAAEQGISQDKAPHLWRSRSNSEIAIMNRIRACL